MDYEIALAVKPGDSVCENGQTRSVLSIVSGKIWGPHFRLSGYDETPNESLTSYRLCAAEIQAVNTLIARAEAEEVAA